MRTPGPPPPQEWGRTLRQLLELSLAPVPEPPWWTPKTAYCGGIETRTDPGSYGTVEREGLYFQLTLAGWGQYEYPGHQPQSLTPGKGFFAAGPARQRCCVPESSPGWTFAWIRINHPFLVERVTKHVRVDGPLVDVPPTGTLCATFLRLVRGALRKDFRDHFDAELALWEFVLMYERRQHEMADECGQGQRLLDAVRARIVASLPQAVGVDALAAEYSMSRSHFSHFFRTRTGLTPARFATSVRIHEAARMLRETRAPLKCIADLCGFANANHFCKVFRRVQQLSPASYRRTVR